MVNWRVLQILLAAVWLTLVAAQDYDDCGDVDVGTITSTQATATTQLLTETAAITSSTTTAASSATGATTTVASIASTTSSTTSAQATTTSSHFDCVITSYAGFTGYTSCSSILIQGPFTVPSQKSIDMSKLQTGARVVLSGMVTFNHSTTLSTALLSIGGAGISFTGDPDNTGILHGNGQLYWDGLGTNGGSVKPRMIKVSTSANSYIGGFTILNAPGHCFSVGASDTVIDSVIYDNSAGDQLTSGNITLGHNTDAFDVGSSTNVWIQNSYVWNQDDCLALGSGTNIYFINNTCIGGHGISIGSVNSNNAVANAYIKNCTVIDSLNGIRIKTVSGATAASVTNVTYEDITLRNILKSTISDDPPAMGICVRQDYLNGGPTGVANGSVLITNLTLANIQGTVVSNEFSNAYSVFILCVTGNCNGFNFTNIDITPVRTNCTGIAPLPDGC
ncbi:hypothetical protein HDU83_001322 [Entophlyctis luteolus]|nr:hypothetical protein HDU83_001322 [Entophlyctis luteolus]